MHHLAFFENQVVQRPSAMTSENKPNGEACPENGDLPKEKKISDDMPKWKQEKLRKYNEQLKQELEQIRERRKREQETEKSKWEGLPVWKAALIKRREEEKKKKEEEENQARLREQQERDKWEALPKWKRDIFERKGIKPAAECTPDNSNDVEMTSSDNKAELIEDEDKNCGDEQVYEVNPEQPIQVNGDGDGRVVFDDGVANEVHENGEVKDYR